MDLMRGRHITPKNKKDFYEICTSLGKFTGAMRLFGKLSQDFCEADLLIQEGKIIAVTFENLERGELYLGKNALSQMKKQFIRAGGRLDLYQFDKKDMEDTRKENKDALLSSKIPIESIGLRIKPHEPKKIKEGTEGRGMSGIFSGTSLQKREEIRKMRRDVERGEKPSIIGIKDMEALKDMKSEELVGKQVNLREMQKIFERIKTPSSPEELQRKKSLLNKLAKKRGIIDREIAERIAKLWKEGEKVEEGEEEESKEKIKTSIDKLYDLVKKHHVLKINESLARRLGVMKTQLESWAVILEEHDLVELHYPTIGEPEIREKSSEGVEGKEKKK
jgi:hypothetical protein